MKSFFYEFSESIRIALSQIRQHAMRSVLTALGVIIGIIAVTLMGTAINGIDTGFDKSLSIIGYDVLYVQKWPWRTVDDWWNYRNRPELKTEYADQIKKMISDNPNSELLTVIPQVSATKSVQYGGTQVDQVFIIGTTDDYTITTTADLSDGRFFNAIESRTGRPVCVLGFDVADALFPNASPVGNTIRVGNTNYHVIGVYAKQGKFLGLFSLDNQVVVPLGAFQKYIGKSRQITLRVKIKDQRSLDEAKDELIGVMRRVRGLTFGEKEDFSINEQQAFKSTLDPIKAGISIAGLFITGLSLFVGAIGIMNITFVSVKERTKEIGTRKALGAKRRTILLQFMIEAVTICLIGGVIGLGLSYMLSLVVAAFFPSFPVSFSLELVLIGMGVSILTGVFSGFAPAYTASKLDPATALRYE
ncbi:MAG: FtsX-like permease family protein [Chlorobiales bacterium]|nr:FtsX-like permease family protein [Chlorobiales bacterium]